ncbi:MAG TPA: nitroreductase family protein [Miltoncostaeaceae bacterium]|nr:nitroreductase family protein [Miltoncostaeaceae bacterium]
MTTTAPDPHDAPPSPEAVPDLPVLRALGDRRSIRYFDPERTVERWKIETMLQAARFASCQGNINCTEAIVLRQETSPLWEELEECVSGFNVQIINQASHLILWVTNLNAWYGRAVDGISAISLAGGSAKYHGWNYEFTMTQTLPRLMSFPTGRTEMLLRFETGQAVANAITAGTGVGVGSILIAFGRRPGGVEKALGLPPHYRFTWGHAVGYPLEDPRAGGQRPRLRMEALFHEDEWGRPFRSDPRTVELLRAKGLIQEQGPLPGRFEEMGAIAERFGRDPGVLFFPAREIRRLLGDEDWDLQPALRARAEEVLAGEDLPDYPEEMRETFRRLMAEHGIDARKFLPAEEDGT